MATTYSITDFSHGIYAYTNDAAVANQVSMRNVYATPSGLSLATSAVPQILSKHARRRYIHSVTGGVTSGTSHPLERHYPIAIAQVATPTAPGTIDGVTDWVLKGYRGEQDRA
jgi:hypothetical protein